MKIFWSSLLGLAAMVSSMPSQHQNGTILDGATNNKCSAPEGDGVCQDITNCKGISYPSNLCPYDPTNVQVRACEGAIFPLWMERSADSSSPVLRRGSMFRALRWVWLLPKRREERLFRRQVLRRLLPRR